MKDKSFSITLRCLFCDAPLQGEMDKDYQSGDMIECQNCAESNDYDSLFDVAKEEGIEKVKKSLESDIAKSLKKLFK